MNDELSNLLSRLGFSAEPVQPVSLIKTERSGGFARLYLGTYNQRPVMAKVIYTDKSVRNYKVKFLPRDESALNKLSHPSLVTVHHFIRSTKLVLFTEHASDGSILDLLLLTKQPIPEDECRQYYRQFGSALQYMHSQGFAHRNVKCEKILLFTDSNGSKTCKLSDYGFTRSAFPYNNQQPLLTSEQTYCASAAYVAPEVLSQESGGVKQHPYSQYLADVWSVGVVLYTMLHGGRLPFRDWNLRNWIMNQRAQKYTIAIDPPSDLSDDMKELIKLHLDPEPSTRPDMNTIFEHRWFVSVQDHQ